MPIGNARIDRTQSHPRPAVATTAGDGGFGLVEMLVVMGLIGILCAVAIPTFLTNRQQAQETAAEELLRSIGLPAFQGLMRKHTATTVRAQVQAELPGGTSITYGASARSSAGDRIVATIGPGDQPTAWIAAVQPWPGRCTRIMASTTAGLSAAITTDVGSAGCGASDTSSIILTAQDFLSRLINPYNGNTGPVVTWTGGSANLTQAGMILSDPGAASFVNGVLQGVVTLNPGSYGQGAGLVFHATQGARGALTGFVFQIDPGYPVNGRPGLLLRQWTNGTENNRPLQAVAAPPGFDVTKPHTMQVAIVGNEFVGLVDGVEVMRGQLPPGFGGTQYGMRTWGAGGASVGDLQITPAE